MWRIFWTGCLVVGLLLAGGIYAAVQATFRFKHPRSPHTRIIIDKITGAAMVVPRDSSGPSSAQDAQARQGRPRLVCEQTVHHFGSMPPLTLGRHAFEVRNEGDAELLLQPESTTCKCTVSGVSRDRVPPGGRADILLEWNSGRHNLAFEQAARIKTNDPDRPTLELTVTGQVQAIAALDPAELHLGSAVPGSTIRTSVVLYSQVWERFSIASIQSTREGLHWETQPLPVPPAAGQARSACRLAIAFPAGTRYGRFQETLRILVQPDDASAAALPAELAQPQALYLDLEGMIVRPLAFYGAAVLEDGRIDLGDVPQGRERTVRVMVKVRDAQAELPQARVEVTPEFLQVRFGPASGNISGLYELTLTLPAGTPPCQYRSQPIGRLRLTTGHPRIGEVELPVTFAVVPRRRLSD